MLFNHQKRLHQVVVALDELVEFRVWLGRSCALHLGLAAHLEAPYQLKLVVDAIGLVRSLHLVLLSFLQELGQHVISLCAVFRQLVVRVAHEHICACCKQLSDDF